MNCNFFKFFAPLLMLTFLMLSAPLRAQQEIGKVNKIKAVDIATLKEPTDRVRLRQARGGSWENGYSGLAVDLGDQILIREYTRAYLQIKEESKKGKLLLSSADPDGNEGEAAFRIGEEITRIDGLKLVILKGSLVIDWAQGKMTAVAAGIRCLFEGTKAVFVVQEDGQSAMLYLQEGQISYPDFPAFRLIGPQTARLVEGEAPAIAGIDQMRRNRFDKFTRQETQLWKKPFWQRTGFLIGGGVAAGGLLYILLSNGDDGGQHSGTVEVTIP